MAYIREPTALEYGTLDMYSISSFDTRHKAGDNLKCAATEYSLVLHHAY
jgi:hypothetical protein